MFGPPAPFISFDVSGRPWMVNLTLNLAAWCEMESLALKLGVTNPIPREMVEVHAPPGRGDIVERLRSVDVRLDMTLPFTGAIRTILEHWMEEKSKADRAYYADRKQREAREEEERKALVASGVRYVVKDSMVLDGFDGYRSIADECDDPEAIADALNLVRSVRGGE